MQRLAKFRQSISLEIKEVPTIYGSSVDVYCTITNIHITCKICISNWIIIDLSIWGNDKDWTLYKNTIYAQGTMEITGELVYLQIGNKSISWNCTGDIKRFISDRYSLTIRQDKLYIGTEYGREKYVTRWYK